MSKKNAWAALHAVQAVITHKRAPQEQKHNTTAAAGLSMGGVLPWA